MQGWGYKLRRVLCFFAGTSLIELATALGIPPYLGRVRALLIALHWLTAVMIVWSASPTGSALALAAYLPAMAALVLWAFSKDISARAKGLAALQSGQAMAAELRAELS